MSNRILFVLVFFGLIASASAQDAQTEFSHLTLNAGGGLGIGRGDVAAFVGNSGNVVAGAGWRLSRLFGVDAEYMYYDLNFRPSVKLNQALSNQTGRMQSISLDGIVTVPKHIGKLGAYGIFGIGFYRRTVSVPRQFLNNAGDNPAYRWWDLSRQLNGNYASQYISSNSKDAGGFNFGGGVTYRLNHLHDSKIYLEWRYHRAYQSDGKTIVMPITVGLRW